MWEKNYCEHKYDCLPRKSRSPDLTPLEFCLWGWMKSEVYKREGDERDELLDRILDAVGSIKKREDQRKPTTRVLRTRAAKCREVDRAICGHLNIIIIIIIIN